MVERRRLLLLLLAAASVALYEQDLDEQRTHQNAPSHATTTARAVHRTHTARQAPPTVRGSARAAAAEGTWLSDRVMVAPADDVDLAALAERHGLELARDPGPSGYGELYVPPGETGSAIAGLLADPSVAAAGPVARTFGVGKGSTSSTSWGSWDRWSGPYGTRANSWQWHLDAAAVPADGQTFEKVTVAVLDSGVAYEDHEGFVQAPSLAGVAFRAAWDFANNDAHANDDHGHGTHITSLIASNGTVEGVAPNTSVMPLKVLDADNSGTETWLIDALYHAVDNGADIVNLSLAFGPGYAPSPALLGALQYAWESQVVLIAAAGNDASDTVSWPAASPLVSAIGASTPGVHCEKGATAGEVCTGGSWDHTLNAPAPYSNASPSVQLLAPGGHLDFDQTADGYGDGLLAESIDPQDPSDVGYWFMAGSSQAAAVATGAAVRALAAGTDPGAVARALQYGADPSGLTGTAVQDGWGLGNLQAYDTAQSGPKWNAVADETVYAATVVWVSGDEEKIKARARITLFDEDGVALGADYTAYGSFTGSSSDSFKCTPDDTLRYCTVHSDNVAVSTGGNAWAVRVESVVGPNGVASSPQRAFVHREGLEVVLASMLDEGLLENALLAVYWEEGYDATLDDDVIEAWMVPNFGTGWALGDLNIIFTPPSLPPGATTGELDLDLGGTGWALGDLNIIKVPVIDFGGAGWALGELNLQPPTILGLHGTGWALGDLNFHPSDLFTRGTGWALGDLSFEGPVFPGPGSSPMGSLAGYGVDELLDGTGSVTDEGYSGADVLVGTGAIGVEGWDGEAVGGLSVSGSEELASP